MMNDSELLTKSSHGSIPTEEDLTTDGIYHKLRRLKIEENIIFKNINKLPKLKAYQDDEFLLSFINDNNFECYNYEKKLRNSFAEVRNLFEDVKSHTKSAHDLEYLDIDNVKKDVLELETRIRNLKIFLETEMSTLKVREHELHNTKVIENSDKLEKYKTKQKIKSNPFNEIVVSPVKAIINSPLKSVEVQQFQEFMINSKNNYGGWIAYNHNIFVQSWQKLLSVEKNENADDNQEMNLKNMNNYDLFEQEILQKIPGISSECIMSHAKWYAKYIHLKRRQEEALSKWRTNKQKIKRSHHSSKQLRRNDTVSRGKLCREIAEHENNIIFSDFGKNTETDVHFYEEFNCDFSKSPLKNDDVLRDTQIKANQNLAKANKVQTNASRYGQPTEQWNNRCTGKESLLRQIDVETIKKLHIPYWRLALHAEI